MTLPLQAGRVEADRQQVGDALLDAPLAIAIHGTDLRYRYVNNAFAALNDQSVAAHIGRLPSEILSRKSGEAVERVVQRRRAVLLRVRGRANHRPGVQSR